MHRSCTFYISSLIRPDAFPDLSTPIHRSTATHTALLGPRCRGKAASRIQQLQLLRSGLSPLAQMPLPLIASTQLYLTIFGAGFVAYLLTRPQARTLATPFLKADGNSCSKAVLPSHAAATGARISLSSTPHHCCSFGVFCVLCASLQRILCAGSWHKATNRR